MILQNVLFKIWNEIKLLFNHIPSEIKIAIHIGVIIAENIKNFVDSPVADILTAIIPGDIDDKIKAMLRDKLPVILSELKLAESCSNSTDTIQITNCAINTLKNISGDIKNAFMHNIAILVAQVAADGKLTWSEGVYLLELYYQNKYKTQE